jgi:hypothetical protein
MMKNAMIIDNEDSLAFCSGRFEFSPERPGMKKIHRLSNQTVIVNVDSGIIDYYSYWLWKYKNIKLSRPAWGAHVTIVNDKDRVKDIESFERLKDDFNKSYIKIFHSVKLRKQWQFWILDVEPSEEFLFIRNALGIKENFPFHITIGRDDV